MLSKIVIGFLAAATLASADFDYYPKRDVKFFKPEYEADYYDKDDFYGKEDYYGRGDYYDKEDYYGRGDYYDKEVDVEEEFVEKEVFEKDKKYVTLPYEFEERGEFEKDFEFEKERVYYAPKSEGLLELESFSSKRPEVIYPPHKGFYDVKEDFMDVKYLKKFPPKPEGVLVFPDTFAKYEAKSEGPFVPHFKPKKIFAEVFEKQFVCPKFNKVVIVKIPGKCACETIEVTPKVVKAPRLPEVEEREEVFVEKKIVKEFEKEEPFYREEKPFYGKWGKYEDEPYYGKKW